MAPPERQNKKVAAGRRTRERLLGVARELFGELGYAGTATEEIVRRAGVTRGALYHHFGGKPGLFEAVVRRLHTEIGREIARRVEPTDDPLAAWVAANHQFLAAFRDPVARRLLLVEAPAVLGWERWRAIDDEHVLGGLKAYLRRLAAGGIIQDHPVEALAHVISGAANEAAFWIAESEDPDQALAQAQSVMTALIQSLRA